MVLIRLLTSRRWHCRIVLWPSIYRVAKLYPGSHWSDLGKQVG